MHRSALAVVIVSSLTLAPAALVTAQTAARPATSGTANAINGTDSYPEPGAVKYAAAPNPHGPLVDLFLSDWQGSLPRAEHGSLVLRDILTKGDNFDPPQRGAVLSGANFLAYGRLAPGYRTTPEKLKGQQEVFYILSGEGSVSSPAGANGATAAVSLKKDIAVLVPAGVEFSLYNNGDKDLTMYVINEPTPGGFVPRTHIVVKDESQVHQRTPGAADPYIVGGASGHWAHIVKELFSPDDGLATLQSVITVTINPRTMGEPHPHKPNQEEIWAAIDGNSLMLMGTELRVQKPGMAYMVRPDGVTIHSNINSSDAPVKFLYFARFPPGMDFTHAVPAAIPAPK